MRLICPKCDAQYDIADDVIPPGGRDVQCSSCAHTWFQMDKPAIAGRPLTRRPEQKPPVMSDAPRHAPIESPSRKPLDSSIADILREEAAREQEKAKAGVDTPRETAVASARTSGTAGMTASERAAETRRRIAEMTGDAAATPAAVAAASTGAVAPGVNLRSMPDIEEINATLRARAQVKNASGLTEAEQEQVAQRRGFRRGFFVMLALIALLIAPYFLADQITENLPQTKDAMAQYVQTVDQLRAWLGDQAQKGREMASELMSGDSTETPAGE